MDRTPRIAKTALLPSWGSAVGSWVVRNMELYIGMESARRLVAAGNTLEPVDLLWVAECGALYSHEGVIEIARWEGAGSIVGFSIAWGADHDITELVRSRYLHNVRNLGVWNGKVTNEGIAQLAAWPFAATLRSLDLKDNAITDAGAFALAESPYLGQLHRLDLYRTQISTAGQERLRERFGEALQM